MTTRYRRTVERFLRHDVTWLPRIGSDAYTGNTFGDPVVVRARWNERAHMVPSDDGVEVTSGAKVTLQQPVRIGDKLVDPFSGRERFVKQVDRATDTRGVLSHYVAHVQ